MKVDGGVYQNLIPCLVNLCRICLYTTRKTVISIDTISVDSKVDADTRISASTLESGR
jgi:hypothetical protein